MSVHSTWKLNLWEKLTAIVPAIRKDSDSRYATGKNNRGAEGLSRTKGRRMLGTEG
jgi:hypothetical protein